MLKLENISLVHSISTYRKDFYHHRKISMRIKSKSMLTRGGLVRAWTLIIEFRNKDSVIDSLGGSFRLELLLLGVDI